MISILFILALGAMIFVYLRKQRELEQHSELTGEGSGDRRLDPEIHTNWRPYGQKTQAAQPEFRWDPLALMENVSCEVCRSQPRVQYRKAVNKSVLEFCGHHSRKVEKPLLEQGYSVSLDAR